MMNWTKEALTAFSKELLGRALTEKTMRAALDAAVKAQGLEDNRLYKDGYPYAKGRAEAFEEAGRAISTALNNYIVDMKPDQDDSITGFNEAWNIVADTLLNLEKEPPK